MTITLKHAQENIGNSVVYQPYIGADKEDGKIISVNKSYVMVLFTGDQSSKAVSPELLNMSSEFLI